MEKDEGHVSPTPSPPQLAVRVADKLVLVDDEGIGGSEDNSPRPGSSLADNKSPVSMDNQGVRNQSATEGDDRNQPSAEGEVRAASPQLSSPSSPQPSPRHSQHSSGPSPRESPQPATQQSPRHSQTSPGPSPRHSQHSLGPSPRESPEPATQQSPRHSQSSPGPSPRHSQHSPGPSPRESPEPATQQSPRHSQTSPGPSPRHSQNFLGPSPRESPQPATQQSPRHSQTSPGPSPRHSQLSPGPSPRESPEPATQQSPRHSQTSPGPSPRHSQHSPGPSPRESPEPATQQSPRHSQTSPGPSPRHSQHSPGPSPRESPQPATQQSPRHSQTSPGPSPRHSQHSSGPSPRESPQPATQQSPRHSQTSPGPSPRHSQHSSGPSPRESPQPATQQSPRHSQTSLGPSPRHSQHSSGPSPRESPEPAMQQSPRHSQYSPGPSPRHSQYSPGPSPRDIPQPAEQPSPRHSQYPPEPSHQDKSQPVQQESPRHSQYSPEPSPRNSPDPPSGQFSPPPPRSPSREGVRFSVGGSSLQTSPQPSPRQPASGEVIGSQVLGLSPQPSPQPSPRHSASREGTSSPVIGTMPEPQPSPRHSASIEGTDYPVAGFSPQPSPQPSPRSPSREGASSPAVEPFHQPSPGPSPSREGAVSSVVGSSPRPSEPSSLLSSPEKSPSRDGPGSSVGDSSLDGLAESIQSSPARTIVGGSSLEGLENSAASSPARSIVVTADVEPVSRTGSGVPEIDAVADVNDGREPGEHTSSKAAPARFVRRCGGGESHHHSHHQTSDSSSRRTPHHQHHHHNDSKMPSPPKRPKSAAVRKRRASPPDVSEGSFQATSPQVSPSSSVTIASNKTFESDAYNNNINNAYSATTAPDIITTNLDNEFYTQLQQAMSALQEYQAKLRSEGAAGGIGVAGGRGGVSGSQEAEDLRQTLRTLTRLCETCSSTSQALGSQLRAARQLSDSIGQDLAHRLEASPDLKDWIPPGCFVTDGDEAGPEARLAAQRERLARAAEARAAVARASHAMQAKTEELARAEAKMAEAEMEAATAREAAEDAVRQLEATQAAEEARQRQEEEMEEATRREEGEEHGDLTEEEAEGQDVGDSPDQQEEDWAQADEDSQVPLTPQDEGTLLDDDQLQCEPGRDEFTPRSASGLDGQQGESTPPPYEQQGEIEQEGEAIPPHDVDHADEEEEQHIEFTTDAAVTEPELASQKVFQDVHLVSDQTNVAEDQQTCSRFIFSVDSGDWDTGLGCVVRPTATQISREVLNVTRVLPARAELRLHDGEELISNIVQVTARGITKFSPFLSVSLPHCAPRMHPGREPCIRMRPLSGGGWKDLPTCDVTFDDIKEHKFVEVELHEPGTLCVVLRLKRDEVELTRQGGKAMASADSRVTLSWPSNVVKLKARLTMGVQLLDQAAVSEVRARPDLDCSPLMSCSPVVQLQAPGVKLLHPVTLSLPCPPNPAARPQRPATGTDRSRVGRPGTAVGAPTAPPAGGGGGGGGGEGGDQRPATARPFFGGPKKVAEEIYEDELHVLWRRDGGTWTLLPDMDVQETKKKDVVTIEIRVPLPRLLLLRTRTGLPQATVERMATTLEHLAAHHTVHLVLRQHRADPASLVLTYVSDVTMERSLRALADEGYNQGPPSSGEIRLREGQVLEVGFRGNIQPSSGEEGCEFVPRCVFFTNIPFMLRFCATEIDRFAQKGFDTYRGFAQVSTTYAAPFRRSNSSSGGLAGGAPCWQARGMPPCFVTGKQLLAELVVSLPKPDPEPPKPLNTAPVILKSYGPVTNDLLRYVAQQLAADDWRRLAPLLNVRRTRLQAILRQNVSAPAWLSVYDVLVTWSKRLPQAFDRVEMLCAALTSVGRNDLAEEVRDRESSFRHEHFISTREALLHKAFVRIARHEKAVLQWRRLAVFLGISETAVLDIHNATPSARERCMQSLQRWKESQDTSGDLATVTLLSRKLRLCRYRALAREIESIR